MGLRIAIVGAGGVGGMCAGHMARNGEDVTFIDPWPDHVEKMNKDGRGSSWILDFRGTDMRYTGENDNVWNWTSHGSNSQKVLSPNGEYECNTLIGQPGIFGGESTEVLVDPLKK